MAKKYFSPGPKPRTERGKRRHSNRSNEAAEHAKQVHVDRDVWLQLQSFKPCGQAFGRASL